MRPEVAGGRCRPPLPYCVASLPRKPSREGRPSRGSNSGMGEGFTLAVSDLKSWSCIAIHAGARPNSGMGHDSAVKLLFNGSPHVAPLLRRRQRRWPFKWEPTRSSATAPKAKALESVTNGMKIPISCLSRCRTTEKRGTLPST
ncbi:hypothetical protein EJ110_NYTH31291 [Nymphaea thermarum]|nr:hypothetical protein EJ110_NYTH31291 [Nymphaea thermarum]